MKDIIFEAIDNALHDVSRKHGPFEAIFAIDGLIEHLAVELSCETPEVTLQAIKVLKAKVIKSATKNALAETRPR